MGERNEAKIGKVRKQGEQEEWKEKKIMISRRETKEGRKRRERKKGNKRPKNSREEMRKIEGGEERGNEWIKRR